MYRNTEPNSFAKLPTLDEQSKQNNNNQHAEQQRALSVCV